MVPSEWDDRLAAWCTSWSCWPSWTTRRVPLAIAEAEAGVSRSALRAWYRNGEIASRLVDGLHGPQRLVPLQAVLDRAAQSARIQRRAEREVSLEAQPTLLRHRVDQLELRLGALERDSNADQRTTVKRRHNSSYDGGDRPERDRGASSVVGTTARDLRPPLSPSWASP